VNGHAYAYKTYEYNWKLANSFNQRADLEQSRQLTKTGRSRGGIPNVVACRQRTANGHHTKARTS